MRILLPLDGSDYSEYAVNFLASRSSLNGQHPEIVLLNVQPQLPAKVVDKDEMQDYYKEESDKAFKVARKVLKANKIAFTEVCALGDPGKTIAEEAEKHKVDLIVMGSRGRSAIKGLIFGSVTNNVLALTNVPLLMLRGNRTPKGDDLAVGIAVDGSNYAKNAVKYALKNIALFGPKATFHVINTVSDYAGAIMPDMTGMALPALSEDEVIELQKNEFDEALETVRPLFKRAKVKTKEICLVGNPGDEIAAYANKHHLNVLIIGNRGYGRFKSAVMGSTAMRIASLGDIPLLVIRH